MDKLRQQLARLQASKDLDALARFMERHGEDAWAEMVAIANTPAERLSSCLISRRTFDALPATAKAEYVRGGGQVVDGEVSK